VSRITTWALQPGCRRPADAARNVRQCAVVAIQFTGPHLDDPRVTVTVQQHLSVYTEPTIRREIHGLAGTMIVG